MTKVDYEYIRFIDYGRKVIAQGETLFVRLDKDEEIEYIKSAMSGR